MLKKCYIKICLRTNRMEDSKLNVFISIINVTDLIEITPKYFDVRILDLTTTRKSSSQINYPFTLKYSWVCASFSVQWNRTIKQTIGAAIKIVLGYQSRYFKFNYINYPMLIPNDCVGRNMIGWRKDQSETICHRQSSDIYKRLLLHRS